MLNEKISFIGESTDCQGCQPTEWPKWGSQINLDGNIGGNFKSNKNTKYFILSKCGDLYEG